MGLHYKRMYCDILALLCVTALVSAPFSLLAPDTSREAWDATNMGAATLSGLDQRTCGLAVGCLAPVRG